MLKNVFAAENILLARCFYNLIQRSESKSFYAESNKEMEPQTMKQTHAHDHDVPSLTWQRDVCFGCGPANPNGLQLKFELTPDGKSFACRFELGSRFAGPPGHAHGGIIATVLDEAMGKANKLKNKIALTRHMEIDYLRPVPLEQPLVVEGRVVRMSGRALYNRGEIRNAKGTVLARSRGKFLTIDAEQMFARELESERQKNS
jgi:uncharacterized protein (TIGR00369 family)